MLSSEGFRKNIKLNKGRKEILEKSRSMIRNRADLNTYFALMSQNKPRMKAFSLHKESPSDVLFIIFNNF